MARNKKKRRGSKPKPAFRGQVEAKVVDQLLCRFVTGGTPLYIFFSFSYLDLMDYMLAFQSTDINLMDIHLEHLEAICTSTPTTIDTAPTASIRTRNP